MQLDVVFGTGPVGRAIIRELHTRLFPRLQAGVLRGAASVGARLVVIENLYAYGPTNGRPLTEDLPLAATTRKGATRAAMTAELLAARRRGVVQVAIGRASDFFGPWALNSAMGASVFDAVLDGKSVRVLGDPDLAHTYSYIDDVGRGRVRAGGARSRRDAVRVRGTVHRRRQHVRAHLRAGRDTARRGVAAHPGVVPPPSRCSRVGVTGAACAASAGR